MTLVKRALCVGWMGKLMKVLTHEECCRWSNEAVPYTNKPPPVE